MNYILNIRLIANEKFHAIALGKGRALDNVFIERFWRSLKQEKIYMIILNTVKEAKNAITDYINFYNKKRMHQSLEYLTPEQVHFRKIIV